MTFSAVRWHRRIGVTHQRLASRVTAVRGCFWLADPVLPSFLSGEVLFNEIFQGDATDEVVQAPPGGDMADDQDPLLVPAQWQVGEETADAGDGLPSAFPARVGLVQVLAPTSVQLGYGHPVVPPVVTFAQPPVTDTAAPQLPRLSPAPVGQTGRAASLWRDRVAFGQGGCGRERFRSR